MALLNGRDETRKIAGAVLIELAADDAIDNESTAYQHNGDPQKKKDRHVSLPLFRPEK